MVQQAQLLQSLYEQETSRFENTVRKIMRKVKEEETASALKVRLIYPPTHPPTQLPTRST